MEDGASTARSSGDEGAAGLLSCAADTCSFSSFESVIVDGDKGETGEQSRERMWVFVWGLSLINPSGVLRKGCPLAVLMIAS